MATSPRHLIVQLTDFHLGSAPDLILRGINTTECLDAVLAHLKSHHPSPDRILLTGDLAEEPSDITYQRIGRYFDHYEVPVHFLPGNHDQSEVMQRVLSSQGLMGDKVIECGHWRILMLDSTHSGSPAGMLGCAERQWLDATLESLNSFWVMIALHHHPIASGSAWMDTMMIEDRAEFLEIVARHTQVRAVVFGHVHQEIDEMQGSIRFLGTPATCFQFMPLSDTFGVDKAPPGYRLIALEDDGSLETLTVRLSTE